MTAAAASATEQAPPPAPGAQERFDALVSEIGSLRDDLAWLDRRKQGLVGEVDRLQVALALSTREQRRLTAEAEGTRRSLEQTRARLDTQRKLAAAAETGLGRHLREAYKMGKLGDLRLLLAVTRPTDFLAAVGYINMMTQRQSLNVQSVQRQRAEIESLEHTLGLSAATLDALLAQERGKSAEMGRIRARASQVLADIGEQSDAHHSAIAELTRAAEDLEQAIVSSEGPDGSGLPVAAPAVDVARLRGAVEWPVEGEIAVPFGEIRHPRFKTVTPHPGVDIATEPGAPIRAVLPGRVVFSRRFSGYGNTVLVDHGGHYLSVTARAAIVQVVEGEEVLPGQVLGTSADEAPDGGPPTVYFEFRHEGKAVDPTVWLKRRPGSRREDTHR
ncbi:MAG TPA: peptidoglycan DD-metalloendopeptidase family protein [Candidatus Polarisedimenticolia bacterium]|nr:peptidoglycan DD-metalloendopeptidase family protein [Candidatus Polarisedimenticolia bacterium]